MNNELNNEDLEGLSKNQPFKTGNDYFENFANTIQNKVNDYEELSSIAPILSSIPKYNPFELPKNYFDDFAYNMQTNIPKSKTLSVKEWLMMIIKPKFAIPVFTVALLASVAIKYTNNAIQKNNYTNYEYTFDDAIQNIDESIIIDELVKNSSPEKSSEQQEILDYLIENNIDENRINEL